MMMEISFIWVYYVIGNSLTLHPKIIRERARCLIRVSRQVRLI